MRVLVGTDTVTVTLSKDDAVALIEAEPDTQRELRQVLQRALPEVTTGWPLPTILPYHIRSAVIEYAPEFKAPWVVEFRNGGFYIGDRTDRSGTLAEAVGFNTEEAAQTVANEHTGAGGRAVRRDAPREDW
jgi:hypothetical protein